MFRRRKAEVDPTEDVDAGVDGDEAAGPRARGPWDAGEVSIDEDDESRVDLGGLLVTPHDELDVQLQVDQASGEVVAVVLAAEDGAAEVRVFAAPRHGDIWEGSRTAVAGEIAQLGGTATERKGPFGPELAVSLTVELPDGQHAVQESVVLGVAGPRWLLRATLFGRPAFSFDPDGNVESCLRDLVVVRGTQPIPPGDALPLTVPPEARQADPQAD